MISKFNKVSVSKSKMKPKQGQHPILTFGLHTHTSLYVPIETHTQTHNFYRKIDWGRFWKELQILGFLGHMWWGGTQVGWETISYSSPEEWVLCYNPVWRLGSRWNNTGHALIHSWWLQLSVKGLCEHLLEADIYIWNSE